MRAKALFLALASAAALLMAGCGGSSSPGSGSSSPGNSNANSGSGGTGASPAVSITAPANGATVSGTVTVSASATDSVAVAKVQFQVDGANAGNAATAAPYSDPVDTTKLSNGSHTLTAVATDASGNSATSAAVTVTVSNSNSTAPPSVSITAPASGATVSGTVTVTANATGKAAVAKVQFQVDGANVGNAVTAAPYSYMINTATLSNGSHTLTAVATDTAGNSATSAAVTVTVSNSNSTTPPSVAITAPTQGSTVFGPTVGSSVGSSQLTLTATASDSAGVASVQFQVDGVPIGQKIVAAPYSYLWDTTTVANGPHTLTAVAVDTASNRTTSAGVTVTVSSASPTVGAAGPLVAAGTSQPASNYFRVSGTSTVLMLTGSHTWNDMQDEDDASGATAFDFNAYVSFLKSHGANATILWHKDLPTWCNWGAGGTWTLDSSTGMPWSRTGTGNASDGKPKFDLTAFNAAYFNRLAARVSQLQQNGIYAIVELFDGLGLTSNRCGTSSPGGDGYPLTGANNVNGVDDGYTSGSSGVASMTMSAANAITNVQDAYVQHVIDTLNAYPNVIWEVSEEAPTGSNWWQQHMIGLIHSYESGKASQHPVLLATLQSPGNDSALFATNADAVAPHAKLSPTNDCSSGTPACKIDFNDSDHSYYLMWNDSAQVNRNYLWENFTDGAHVLFMDPYEIYWSSGSRNLCSAANNGVCAQPDSRWNNFRDNLGYAQVYANTKLDLVKMTASPGLASTGYCLADNVASGAELLVYAPSGGAFTVNLSAQKGATLRVEWLDPSTGAVSSGTSVTGGSSSQSFTPPWGSSHDAVLYLVDAAGHN